MKGGEKGKNKFLHHIKKGEQNLMGGAVKTRFGHSRRILYFSGIGDTYF